MDCPNLEDVEQWSPGANAVAPSPQAAQSPQLPRSETPLSIQQISSIAQSQAITSDQVFNSTLVDSNSIKSLAQNMEKARVTSKDLARPVRRSDLAQKDNLVTALEEFAQTAGETRGALLKFRYSVTTALRTIGGAQNNTADAIEQFERTQQMDRSDSLFSWRSSWWHGATKSTESMAQKSVQSVEDRLREMLTISHKQFLRLQVEAQAIEKRLKGLENIIDAIMDLVLDEGRFSAKPGFFSSLWERLAGLQEDIHNYKQNSQLLGELSSYGTETQAQVSVAILALEEAKLGVTELQWLTSPEETEGLTSIGALKDRWKTLDVQRLEALQDGERGTTVDQR